MKQAGHAKTQNKFVNIKEERLGQRGGKGKEILSLLL